MTDIQATQRYIQAFDAALPELSDDAFWCKLRTGTQWMISKFPDSPFAEVCEEYEQSLFKLALIKAEIMKEGGKHIDRCRKEI